MCLLFITTQTQNKNYILHEILPVAVIFSQHTYISHGQWILFEIKPKSLL
jgi:hypothetical protein